MGVVALVPLDVWATLTKQPVEAVGILWDITYWSTQGATWIVLPFYQVYSEAGDFTVRSRCWTSIKENMLLYGVVGTLAAFGVGMLFAFQRVTLDTLMGVGIGISNTFGLVVGILLMGYGLVEIPKQMWKSGNPVLMLKQCAHKCGRHAEAVMKSTSELETVITIIYANQRQMRRHDALHKYMDVVASYAETHSPIKPSLLATRTVDIEGLRAEDLEYNYDLEGLAILRRRLFWAVADYKGFRAMYEKAILDAFELEAIAKARSLREYTSTQPTEAIGVSIARRKWPWDRYLWIYKCTARSYVNKVFAVIFVMTSLCIVWGEATIPVPSPDLSPFSHMIRDLDRPDQISIQIVTLLPLVYICSCMYYTLFRINAFNYNKLVPHATVGPALMQNGMLMCRFAAPTCWNFYHIIRMTKDVCNGCDPTVFSQKMSTMDVLPVSNFNTWLPVALVAMCAITAFNMWDMLLQCCTSPRYRFTVDDVDDAYTEKGRLLIRREQDAATRGLAIGEVLHATLGSSIDDDSSAAATSPPKRSFFGRLFGKKSTLLEPEAPQGTAAKQSGSPPGSRWVGSRGAELGRFFGGSKTSDQGGGDGRPSRGPVSSLDGIFADATGGK
ncbi:LMBR1-like membrane protein-domain-containing protein [Dunaliella salina]|uniref:LMBR1-like membrane protein-domain-containing protein n=1 Tax=Dunaliella salina TaxID=3046 RepID=A0ABQ7GPD1_DUNSA|nr:LMBR1-like membrane protein-domain-containing protein [Dunaliella salina]|eukprot:KAF5836465.1 LMBR1-like membrane protein-domain-containing protein [Dunaliella salina]